MNDGALPSTAPSTPAGGLPPIAAVDAIDVISAFAATNKARLDELLKQTNIAIDQHTKNLQQLRDNKLLVSAQLALLNDLQQKLNEVAKKPTVS